MSQWTAAFVQRLRELGWIEGRNVAIEYRWGEGRTERYAKIVAELVRLKVDVIVTHSAEPVLAAKQATSVIPIVFAVAADPVDNGLVASLARPGGNVTGLSLQFTDLAGKRLELLREVVPGLRRLGDHGQCRCSRRCPGDARGSGRGQQVRPRRHPTRNPTSGGYRARLRSGQRAARRHYTSVPTRSYSPIVSRINTLALGARLPTMHAFREYVEAGGLMSYGANFPDLFRHAGDYVDKILRGAKPADIPVEQPTKFDLVINLTTAKALGLNVPPTLLARADEVIE